MTRPMLAGRYAHSNQWLRVRPVSRANAARADRRFITVQAAGVDRAPLAVAAGLNLVQPQDVDVQQRVAVAAGVLREDRHRNLMGVLEPAHVQAVDAAAVMTGADERGLAPHVRCTSGRTDCSISARCWWRVAPIRRLGQVAGLGRLNSGGGGGGVDQGNRLVDREGGVPVLDADRALVPCAGLDPQLGLALAGGLGLGYDLGLLEGVELGVDPGLPR
jgi:hypothetical protein